MLNGNLERRSKTLRPAEVGKLVNTVLSMLIFNSSSLGAPRHSEISLASFGTQQMRCIACGL
jgi:hypothetical protein